MIILLIGPSGIGKTYIGNAILKSRPMWTFYDLDTQIQYQLEGSISNYLVQFGAIAFMRQCDKALNKIKSKVPEERPCVVAAGAGIFPYHNIRLWLRQYKTIALLAPVKQCYEQWKHKVGKTKVTQEIYQHHELSSKRMDIYREADDIVYLDKLQPFTVINGLLQSIETFINP